MMMMLLLLLSSSLVAQNLITHGNFDDNLWEEFDTDYVHNYGLGGDNDTGKFYLGNNAHNNSTSMFNFNDHTTGNGQTRYMIVNGHTQSDKLVWGMTLSVQAHSYYDFSLWMTNLSAGGGTFGYMRSKLKIKINNDVVVDEYNMTNVSSTQGIWNQMPAVRWYSRNTTTARIEIYDLCTSDNGNDFGLDDLSFTYQYTNVVQANTDYATTCFETPVDINPMQNDVIQPSSLQSQVNFSIVSQPSHGSLTLLNGTNYRYTPNTGYSGADSFTYKLTYGTNDIVSTGTVNITVNARPQRVINQHACESFTWSGATGQTYTQNGQYTYVKPNPSGCDSLLVLNLTIHHAEEETLPAVETCDSYTWHGTTYTQSGTYDYVTTTQWGCVLTQHLPLTIHYGDTVDYNISACEQYTWHGQTFTSSGTHTYLTTNSFGCDRLERLHLTITDRFRQVENLTECDSYYWPRKQQWYYASAMDSVTVNGPQGGCDSTFVLNLTLHFSEVLDPEPAEACDSYTWHGTTYNSSGLYSYQTTNQYGCELTEQLQLTIHESETVELDPLTVCDSYAWHGRTYTESGVAVFDTVNQHGCNLQYLLPLTINHSDTLDWEPVTECDSYLWYGQTVTESGQYIHLSTTPQGCDRLERIYITINHSSIDTLAPITACDNYEWHGQTYTQTGYYTYEGEGPTGCPATEIRLITINHSSENEINVTSCGPYEWYGTVYDEPGTYYHELTNSQGCDSLLVMHLAIGETFTFEESITGCDTYEWHGNTYDQNGDYEVLVENPSGCDSLFTLHLTIAPNYQVEDEASACNSYTWIDQVITESGMYERHFQSTDGCDSLVTMYVTILEPVHHTFEQQTCQPFAWNGITYYENGDYDQTFEAANGCDSIATMHLVFSDAMTSEFERQSCSTISWQEHVCDHNGDYTHIFQSEQGCDSIVTMHFTLTSGYNIEFDTIACDPFEWYGFECQYYTPTGMTIHHTFTTEQGCDSVVIKHVFLNVPDTSTQFISACDYKEYMGVVYDQPGIYFVNGDTIVGQSGCDSLIYRTRIEIRDSSTLGQINGVSNAYVASNLISGIYRYSVDAEGLLGSIEWNLSNPDWQIVETGENYCLVFVGTPGSATLTASFSVAECGEMERTFEINADYFGLEDGQTVDAKIYPNPTQGQLTVEAEGIERIRVVNMVGQVLDDMAVGREDQVTLNLNRYAPSVYLLEIETAYGMAKRRVTVCR